MTTQESKTNEGRHSKAAANQRFGKNCISAHSNLTIQPKLAVNQPNDIYEQEADRVAEQVVGMPDVATSSVNPAGTSAVVTSLQRSGTSNEGLQVADEELETQLSISKGAGSPLPDEARLFMEQRFGADFSQVQIHADSVADDMNRQVSAHAFTHNQHIYFRDGRYNPESDEGKRLLAHELTHVVQQSPGAGRSVSESAAGEVSSKVGDTDAVQREEDDEGWFSGLSSLVESAGSAVASGAGAAWDAGSSVVSDAGSAIASGAGAVWDAGSSAVGEAGSAIASGAGAAWDAGSSVVGDAGSAIASGAGAAWDAGSSAVSSAGSTIASGARRAASGVADVAGEAWHGARGVAGDVADFGMGVYGQMQEDAGYVRQGVGAVEHGIDWLEDEAKGGTHWLAQQAEGIPVLEQLAGGAESITDFSVDVTGGALKGVTGMAGGLLGMAANPVDAARTLWTMTEHIPGLGLPQKALHGAYDMAFSDKSMGQIADETLNPMADARYWGGIGRAVWAPLQASIDAGKPGEAIGNAGVQIAAMLSGVGEAGAVAEGAEAASIAGEAGTAAELAEAAEAASAAGEAGTAAEMAEAAEAAEAAAGVRVPVEPNVNPFGPTEVPPPNPVGPTEFPPEFFENPTIPQAPRVPNIPEVPPGGFPQLPPSPASTAAVAETAEAAEALTGMRVETLGTSTGELAGLTDAEIEAFTAGLDSGGAQSGSFFEFPGQNPTTGGGLQEITTRINPNPNQISYNVNHYFSDVGGVQIADMGEVPMGIPRVGESIIPEGVGTAAEATPQTYLATAEDNPVLNAGGEPIGSSNVEARYHSTNPQHPAQGPTVQVNSPSDRFGWAGDRSIAVEGATGRYMLPDGTWKTIAEMTPAERAVAHWPVGH